MKTAILGAGKIAGTLAVTMRSLAEVECYAVASRSLEKAQQFAAEHGFQKAYGSYSEMLADEEVELVYIATPHSHHYEHMKLCIEAGKHALCEKAFTTTREQAEEIFRLAKERELPAQSHLSENTGEIQWVKELHPDCGQYWETYAKYGLWNDRTLMAHCVWCDERERRAMRNAGVTAVHCPDSNQNICSGVAPVRVLLNEGVSVALGTDVAGGDTLSMLDAASSAIRASKARRILDGWETDFLTAAEAWYLATSAGAAFFGEGPGFAPGNALHALVLDDSRLLQPHPLTPEERLERCLYVRQPGAVRGVWSAGRRVFSPED